MTGRQAYVNIWFHNYDHYEKDVFWLIYSIRIKNKFRYFT